MRTALLLKGISQQGLHDAALAVQGGLRLSGAFKRTQHEGASRSLASSTDQAAPPPPDAFTELLMKVVPPIVALPRTVVNMTINSTGAVARTLASSDVAKSAVSWVAQKGLLAEPVYKVEEVDQAAWAYWLASAGYTDKQAFATLAAAVKPKIAGLAPSKVVRLVIGFHRAGVYDKDLFSAVAENIKANYTEYDAEDLLKVVAAFADFGHYEEALFDDIADSITYCNSMFASEAAPLEDVANAFAAYAKYNHERGDLFNALQRGLWNLYKKKKLNSIAPESLKASTLKIARSFSAFNYWPYNTQMVLGVAKKRPEIFTEAERKEIEDYAELAETYWGRLTYYREGFADWKHYHEHAQIIAPVPNLYALDDSLVPKEYVPTALRAKA